MTQSVRPTQTTPAAHRQPQGAPARAPDADNLRIGGLTRLTTIDYPGELAAVVFCQGCPWRCRYCHNTDLLDARAEARIPWPDIRAFLQQRIGLLDAVVFSGGEPTAQGALSAAMREVRALGFKVGLHTGGAYPERLRALLPLIDWVGLDIKALPDEYPAITGVPGSGQRAWESLDVLLTAQVPMEVRTTLMPDWTPERIATLAHALADAGVKEYCVQACDSSRAWDERLGANVMLMSERMGWVERERFATFIVRGE
ncbi:anaerobic ribonucleoside-triphosphate reductase activating protein [Thiocystis violacea]|uniref:anaerobic ribonucleoside-triphosphate reductase activating protein n=1 Tax=Thiocystis violacea TaxID=13725 RepID=UPI0019048079|nr:anaerobic ribonucleoside-triphosphate reductase activating protein [Thiocystis violacea]MBK1719575.1 anaerobic ribonucleoside-triphosphate reductase activating protein [Thiocystis violacea]